MRVASGGASRIPSSDDSGFPATGHDSSGGTTVRDRRYKWRSECGLWSRMPNSAVADRHRKPQRSCGHGRPEVRPPASRELAHASPRLSGPWMGWYSRRRIPSGLLRLTRGSPGWRAIARRSRAAATVARRCDRLRVVSMLTTRQGCRGHGWAGVRAGASLRACFGFRAARQSGEPLTPQRSCGHGRPEVRPPASRELAHASPRLSGPWMGWYSRRRIPSGLLRLTRGSPGWRAIARRSRAAATVARRCDRLRVVSMLTTRQGCRGHGWPDSREVSTAAAPRAWPEPGASTSRAWRTDSSSHSRPAAGRSASGPSPAAGRH